MNSRQEKASLRPLNNGRGFSLLELVIALFLSTIVVVVILATFRLAIRSEEKGTRRQDHSQHVRSLTSQISFLLKGAYPYVARIDDEQKYYFQGKSDDLSFITSSVTQRKDSLINKSGLKWVRIFTDSEGLKIKENFFFLDDDYENDSAEERLLDESVTEMSFEYLDSGEDGEDEPEWTTEWSADDKEYLPAAISVTLQIQEEDKELTFPLFTVKVQLPKKIQ